MRSSNPMHLEILRKLKENEGRFISGEELAEAFQISRPGIWKHINRLKKMGYQIQSQSGRGYMLTAVPDSLAYEEIVPALKTKWLARSYHYLSTVGSTNDHTLVLAAEGSPHGTVVVAEVQTEGRGRLKREWISHPGCGIYMSILLRSLLPVRMAAQSTHIASLALVATLRKHFGLEASVKWPNDVLVNGRKVAGILTEIQSDQEFSRFIVIGIGINVNQSREQMDGPFRYPATSIAIESGLAVKRQLVLGQFLGRFEYYYDCFMQEGVEALIPEIESYSAVIGKTITVVCGDREITGRAQGFTHEGALLLAGEDGVQETIWAGDVSRVVGTI